MKVLLYNLDMIDHVRSEEGAAQLADLKKLRDEAAARNKP